jgi:hypothetical protein
VSIPAGSLCQYIPLLGAAAKLVFELLDIFLLIGRRPVIASAVINVRLSDSPIQGLIGRFELLRKFLDRAARAVQLDEFVSKFLRIWLSSHRFSFESGSLIIHCPEKRGNFTALI